MLVKFEQNRMVQTTRNLEFFDQKKKKKKKKRVFFPHFWQSADAILEHVSVAESIVYCWNIKFQTTIFQRSKNYVSLTRVTRLKVAPNMADPISIKDSVSNREVNNRLTGWAFAHPVNSTCPLPKIAHPVNYPAHSKMGTMIIKHNNLDLSFCKIHWPQRGNLTQVPSE